MRRQQLRRQPNRPRIPLPKSSRSPVRSTRRSGAISRGATSDRTAQAAWSPSPDPSHVRMNTISARQAAESGRRPTAARRSSPSRTNISAAASARSRRAKAIRTSSTPAAAKRRFAATFRTATACGRRTDGGKTWTSMGLRETQYISRIRINPTNPDIVYVGALGHVFGPNSERGVFKTTDGGKSWKKILYRNDSTGVADLIMEPGNPNVLYATMWQAYRAPWTFSSGGAGSGIFKTTDGGDHWTEISHNPGLAERTARPHGHRDFAGEAEQESGRSSRTNRAAACIARTTRGATWKFLSGSRDLRQRAWYYSNIYADPKDTNVLAAPQVGAEWSKDGGMTWSGGFGAGDNHDVWWAPDDSKRIVCGARQRRRDHDRRRHDARERRRADGPVLSRASHESLSVSCVRIEAGRRPELRTGARRRAADAAAAAVAAGAAVRPPIRVLRVLRSRGRRERIHRVEPARSRHHLRRQLQRRAAGHRSQDRTDRAPRSVAAQSDGPRRGRFEVPLPVDLSDHELAVQSARAVRRIERRVQVDGRRKDLVDHLARSHAPRSENTRQRGRSDHEGPDVGRVLRHRVRAAGIADHARADVGGIGRRTDPHHARRRQDVEERHAEVARVDARVDHRSVAARCRARRGSRATGISSTT